MLLSLYSVFFILTHKLLLAKNGTLVCEKIPSVILLKDKLKLFMGENEALTFGGQVLATWKTNKRGRTFLLKKQKD